MTSEQIPSDIELRLRQLELLDRITQISLASNNLQDLLRGSLDLILEVFNADRAWFLYPCDPDAPSWGVPMERCRPEWPGLFEQGVDFPMDYEVAGIMREMLGANGTIQYCFETGYPTPSPVATRFSVKSQLAIALRPKIGKAWLLGLHHCSSAVVHDEIDLKLFTTIAFRITDALSALITVRQLRESESRSQKLADSVIDQAGVLVVVLDKHGCIVRFNQACEKLSGYTFDEVEGRYLWDILLPPEDDRNSPRNAAEPLAQNSNGMVGQHANFWLSKSGKRHLIEWSNTQLLDADGSMEFMVCVGIDTTERKQIEHALAKSMNQLEEKELAKTRFFAAAGHDLRQPLAAASLFIGALKFSALTPQQENTIQQLDQSMTTFGGLLDSLLNISKLDSGVIKPNFAPVKLAEIFCWLEQSYTQMAGEKRLGFRLYFPTRETLVVRSDFGLLNSILMNLVSNAIKYTSKGAILISARKRGNNVLFQVWDTGMGISDEDIKHIFDEFYQIDNQQRDRSSGLGLGLAIVKRTTALLGSDIRCRSQIGRGSVFEFRLPLDITSSGVVQQGATGVPPEDVINESFARGKRFIVLEDDALVMQAMTIWLEAMGGEVKCFHSAEDALLHTNIEYNDYYIVDYMLGGKLNGIQFLNLLRQMQGKPVNAVLVTGDTSSNFIRVAVNCDWPVIHKPFNIEKLISGLKTQESKHV